MTVLNLPSQNASATRETDRINAINGASNAEE
jgi:hypothetical protein